DLTETDVTVLHADGSSTETVTDRSANGTLLGQTITMMSADRRTQTVQIDSQGDGYFNALQSKTLNADGSVTVTVMDCAPSGALLDETVTTTSANGLSVTTQQDRTGAVDGSGHPVFALTKTAVTVLNADGSTTE